MKISFIATVLNEGDNVAQFLHSVINQSRQADEIIIVDGGSTDATASVISNFTHSAGSGQEFQISNKKIKFKFIIKRGNRAVGRNEGIKQVSGDFIVCSDAGCILDKDWIKNIIKPFTDLKVDVVAGYYKGACRSVFQKCLVPYVLVMEDKVNPQKFLPASRSMAFRKSIWEKVGGFPEKFSNNEDYVFARKLRKIGAKIYFAKDAIVHWIPRKNLKETFVMFFRFALGDAEAGIFRPKVIFLFLRYFAFFLLLIYLFITKFIFYLNLLLILVVLYVFWAIFKNYRYVNEWKALYCLPIIQVISDIAVMAGTTAGAFSAKKNNE